MEVGPALSSTVLLGTGGVHRGGHCPFKHCVTVYGSVHGGGVLAVYIEVVTAPSSNVLLGTGSVHGGGVLEVYTEVVPAPSSTVLLGTGGIHRGGPCPLKYCVTGYWRCTYR